MATRRLLYLYLYDGMETFIIGSTRAARARTRAQPYLFCFQKQLKPSVNLDAASGHFRQPKYEVDDQVGRI